MEAKRTTLLKDSFFEIRIIELSEVPSGNDLGDIQEKICLHVSNFSENSMSIELLTFAIPEQNHDTTNCRLRSLVILREVTESLSKHISTIDIVQKTLEGELQKAGFRFKSLPFNEYLTAHELIESESMIVNFRKEMRQTDSSSIAPFISFDSISSVDAGSIYSALTQLPGCAISIQIIADNYTDQEKQMLAQLYADYDFLQTGSNQQQNRKGYILAKYPKDQMGYYQSVGQGPMFRVNMVILGEKDMAMQLNTVLRSSILSTNSRLFQMDSFLINEKQKLLSDKKSLPYNISKQIEQYLKSFSAFAAIHSTAILLKYSPQEVRSMLMLPTESLVSGLMPVHLDSLMPENKITSDMFENIDSLYIGEAKNHAVRIPWKSMCNNTAITGNIGTGKSNLLFKMILEARKLDINMLIIEPVKTEYRQLHAEIDELKTFSAGHQTSPLIINVFIPPQGVLLSQYRPMITEIFRLAFDMVTPLDVIFERSLKKTYQKYHWKDYSTTNDPDVVNFGFNEFLSVFKQQIQNSSYSPEIKGNLMSAGFYRFLSLIETDRDTFDCVNTIPTSEYTKGITLVELNSIHSETQKVLIMTITLLGLIAYFKSNPNRDNQRNLIFLDEAHVLLDSLTSNSSSIDSGKLIHHIFMNMLAEFRALRVGMVVCDQMASRIGSKILALCDNKIAFKQNEGAEVNVLSESMQFDEGTKKCLTRLTPGLAIFKSSITKDIPLLIKTQNMSDQIKKLPDEQLENLMTRFYRQNPSYFRPYRECSRVSECERGCSYKTRSDAAYLVSMLLDEVRKPIDSIDTLLPYISALPKVLPQVIERYISGSDSDKLKKCASIQFIRAAILTYPIQSDPQHVNKIIQTTIKEV
jgi:hypothetical protein